jgi:hypothetical protein
MDECVFLGGSEAGVALGGRPCERGWRPAPCDRTWRVEQRGAGRQRNDAAQLARLLIVECSICGVRAKVMAD